MTKILITFVLIGLLVTVNATEKNSIKLVVLGIAQDAGYPQLNCYKPHCMPAWKNSKLKKMATSLALIDPVNKTKYLFEATPDVRQQMYKLHVLAPDDNYKLAGIFLTHAHIGHYTGLVHFGREAAGTDKINVYAMPRMQKFLSHNGPWSQLVLLKNIAIQSLHNNQEQKLSEELSVTPILVPHRDEFSETVGYKISGPKKTVLFIPDIDKWQKWNLDILNQIKTVDYAFLDATFYANGEIPNRDMSQIPHPFVEESIKLFSSLSKANKKKIHFIHFNHSNPLLQAGSDAQKYVLEKGFNFAKEGMVLEL
jgi:pyrroloquinoline quinone biosynthesis protein B